MENTLSQLQNPAPTCLCACPLLPLLKRVGETSPWKTPRGHCKPDSFVSPVILSDLALVLPAIRKRRSDCPNGERLVPTANPVPVLFPFTLSDHRWCCSYQVSRLVPPVIAAAATRALLVCTLACCEPWLADPDQVGSDRIGLDRDEHYRPTGSLTGRLHHGGVQLQEDGGGAPRR